MLVLVFCCLSIKSFFYDYGKNILNNCQEFAHVHIYQLRDSSSMIFLKDSQSSSANDPLQNNCHAGQFLWTHSLFSNALFNFSRPEYKIDFALIFNFENRFESPDLEPRLKPPRIYPLI